MDNCKLFSFELECSVLTNADGELRCVIEPLGEYASCDRPGQHVDDDQGVGLLLQRQPQGRALLRLRNTGSFITFDAGRVRGRHAAAGGPGQRLLPALQHPRACFVARFETTVTARALPESQ